jgi:hypothetical protein
VKRRAESNTAPATRQQEPAHRVRLPGFIIDQDIGLGDVIKRASSYVGIKPCGGCSRRADALNRWIVFTNRSSR